MANDVGREDLMFAAGDKRANVNPAVIALQVLFLRNHNRLAAEYKAANPTWVDEDLFNAARKWNVAQLQALDEDASADYGSDVASADNCTSNCTSGGADVELIDNHAMIMGLTWPLLCVMGVLIARFGRSWRYWLRVHRFIQTVVVSLSFVGQVFAFVYTGGSLETTHGATAIFIICFTTPQAVLGVLSCQKELPDFVFDPESIKRLHRVVGYLLTGFCLWQTYTGMEMYNVSHKYIQLFYAWLVALCVATIFSNDIITTEEDPWIHTPEDDASAPSSPPQEADAPTLGDHSMMLHREGGYQLSWTTGVVDGTEDELEISISVSVPTTGWIGIGFENPAAGGSMYGADMVIGLVDKWGTAFVHDCYSRVPGVPPQKDLDIGGASDVYNIAGTFENGVTTISFSRKFVTEDTQFDLPIAATGDTAEAAAGVNLEYGLMGDSVVITMAYETEGYVAIGIDPSDGGMTNADMYVGRFEGGVPVIEDRYALGTFTPELDSTTQDATLVQASREGGITSFTFVRLLDTLDPDQDNVIEDRTMAVVWAMGSADSFDYHASRGKFNLNFIGAGGDLQSAMMDILRNHLDEEAHAELMEGSEDEEDGNVDMCDAYVCGLAEEHVMNSGLGELFYASMTNQYTRTRDGDRFYFENPAEDGPGFTAAQISELKATHLRDLILLNTDVKRLPANIFFMICWYEYLPSLGLAIEAYGGYKEDTNPSIDNFFSTVAYRYGHSEVGDIVKRVDDHGMEIDKGHLLLQEAFFSPQIAMSAGIEPILRGLASGIQWEVDTLYSPSIQHFLFNLNGHGATDLLARNIQRGRDHGTPLYNRCRQHFGLSRKTSFREVSPDEEVAMTLSKIYK
eukprot:gene15459-18301_t